MSTSKNSVHSPLGLPTEMEQALIASALGEAAYQQLLRGNLSDKELRPVADRLRGISARYTVARDRLSLLAQDDARAYALYYTPLNFAKVAKILQQSAVLPSTPGPLRVLDFGCGPGTASFALIASGIELRSLSLLDASSGMLSVAREIFGHAALQHVQPRVSYATNIADVGADFDVILAANVFSELATSEAAALITKLFGLLTPGGRLLLIDTAQREFSRTLLNARDEVLMRFEEASVVFPCTHRAACPMLAAGSTDDWCHGFLAWECPPLVRALDKLTGFNKHRLKTAALVLAREAVLVDGYRIVTPPNHHRNCSEATACGAGTLRQIRLQKSARSDENRIFLRAELWDRVEIDPAPNVEKGSGAIEAEMQVTLQRFARGR